MSDIELFQLIIEQNSKLTSLSVDERKAYIAQNAQYQFGNSLAYFGAKHIYDPNHAQFPAIQTHFNNFINGKDATKVVVLVESSVPKVTNNINQDIHLSSERGFITHLAKEKNVMVKCLEPDRVEEVNYLLKQFTSDQIELFYYLRAIRSYNRPGMQTTENYEDYSKSLLEQHKASHGNIKEFSDVDFSLENIKAIYKKIFNADLNQNTQININPYLSDTVINKISMASSNFRDFYHIRTIEKYLSEGYYVFVVNGEDHAVVQKSALEKLFNKSLVT